MREDIKRIENKDLFWYTIDERHQIYLNRKKGMVKPWTNDPIYLDYKFTNVFRQLDHGTVWLTENFLKPHKDDSLDLLVFNICWYRKYNWYKTGEILGWQTDWNEDKIYEILSKRSGDKLVTGAHFSIAPPYMPRWEGMIYVCSDLWKARHKIVQVAQQFNLLELTFDAIKEINWIGPFLAYEMVSDIRHTRLLNNAKDIMSWANPGGGAIRGLKRLGLPHSPDEAAIESMQMLLAESASATGDHIPPMEMRDIEHQLCEFDKYCRVKRGEGRPRSLYNGRY